MARALRTVVALGAKVSRVAVDTLSASGTDVACSRPGVVDVGSVGARDGGYGAELAEVTGWADVTC